jgi:hypothetical protein
VKAIIVFVLIALQLAIQVGIPIHKHFCEMDGAFASLVLKIDHKCEQPNEELPPCCQEEKSAVRDTNLQEKDCCSDELQVVKSNFDQAYSTFEWQSVHTEVSLTPPRSNFDFISAVYAEQCLNKGQQYRPPPLFKRGKQIQVRNQVWQI